MSAKWWDLVTAALVDSSAPMWTMADDGRILWCNHCAQALLGGSRARAVTGAGLGELLAPGESRGILDAHRRLRDSASAPDLLTDLGFTADGRFWRGFLFRTAAATLAVFAESRQDLLLRRAHVAEVRFEEFLSRSPAPATIRNERHELVWANPAYVASVGAQHAEEVLGSTLQQIVGPELLPHAEALHTHVRTSGVAFPLEVSLPSGDGRTGQGSGWMFPVPRVDGGVDLGAVLQDLTLRQDLHDRLAQAQDLYRAVFDNSPLPMALVVADRFVEANRPLAEMVGTTMLDLRGRRWWELAEQVDRTAFEAVVQGRRGSHSEQIVLTAAGGKRLPVRFTLVALRRHRDGQATLAVVCPLTWQLNSEPGSTTPLSVTEAEVLVAVAEGRTDAQIARALGVSRQTVVKHVAALSRRCGASGRAGLVARATHLGLLDTAEWPPTARRTGAVPRGG